jgi:hypothetical protein
LRAVYHPGSSVREQAIEPFSNKFRGRAAGQLRQPLVGVEDRIVRVERERAIAHALDHHAVGLVGAFQHENTKAVRALHHDGIDIAAMDGLNGLFRVAC